MREVEFRTIDRLFIKMSINDKIWVMFILFVLALTSVSGARYYNQLEQIEVQAKRVAESQLQGILTSHDGSSVLQVSDLHQSQHRA